MIKFQTIGLTVYCSCSDCGKIKPVPVADFNGAKKREFETAHLVCGRVEKSKLRLHIERLNK